MPENARKATGAPSTYSVAVPAANVAATWCQTFADSALGAVTVARPALLVTTKTGAPPVAV